MARKCTQFGRSNGKKVCRKYSGKARKSSLGATGGKKRCLKWSNRSGGRKARCLKRAKR